MGELAAVLVGRPRPVHTGRREVLTAIFKAPVEGRVAARGHNLDGDRQADLSVHGGADKAVYAYAAEDTEFWEDVLGRDLGPGAFGENLWTRGVEVSGAVIGERWAIGTTVLEVAQPRLPCFKLGVRMGDPAFPRRFAAARRPGAYLRIAREGELGAGDRVEVVERPGHGVTIADFAHAVLDDHARLADLVEHDLVPGGSMGEWIASRVRRTA